MFFEPTEDERKKATELGIVVDKQSGPQLRDEIRKAEIRKGSAVVSDYLRRMAEEIGVEIHPIDRSASLRNRITARIESLLVAQGFTSGVKFIIDDAHEHYGGCEGRITKTSIHWVGDTPMAVARITSQPKVHQINATILLRFAKLVD